MCMNRCISSSYYAVLEHYELTQILLRLFMGKQKLGLGKFLEFKS